VNSEGTNVAGYRIACWFNRIFQSRNETELDPAAPKKARIARWQDMKLKSEIGLDAVAVADAEEER
jgi:hypothetical protein